MRELVLFHTIIYSKAMPPNMRIHNGMTFGNLNVCHLRNKIDDVNVLIKNHPSKVHLFGINETRLDSNIDDSLININNYTFVRKDAEQKQYHTGLVIYIHDSIRNFVRRRVDLETDKVEAIWLELYQKKSTSAYVCALYRNPACTSEWIDDFMAMMDKVPVNSDIILMGDFNINLFNQQNTWLSVISMLGLSQLIQNYTRVKTQTLIDHIYTNNVAKVVNPTIIRTCISDHYAIFGTYRFKLPKQRKNGHDYIQYRSFKHFNETLFLHDIASMPYYNIYNTNDPDKALDLLHMMLLVPINKHAPLRTKRVKNQDLPPWITSEVIFAMHLRDTFKNKKDDVNYKKMKNLVSNMVDKAKEAYFDKLIEEKEDTKTIWRAINTFTKKTTKKDCSSTSISPDVFNQHFLSVSERILLPEQIKAAENFVCSEKLVEFCKDRETNDTFKVPLLTVFEVGKLVSSLGSKKATGPENIPVFFLKLTLPYIVEPLTYIYNLCIKSNTFPTSLKLAKVIPLPKANDKSKPDNFRPISLLPLLSKPLERHFHKHLYMYLQERSLLHINQSGFRPVHSCHTALISLCDSWLQSINKAQVVGTLFLDFRKAFDLVNHSILLQKLSLYLPHSPSINFIKSFLENRCQFVKINKTTSSKGIIKTGVPQGSVLGPLLFLLYINDLPLNLKEGLTNTLFADDASIHTASKDIDEINTNLQDGLDEVNIWCSKNCMSIHPDKTKAMIITTRQKHQRAPLKLSLSLGEKNIQQVNEHKVLGLIIDSDLSWHSHLNSLTKRLSINTYLLSRLKKYASSIALKLFFEAYINSFVNYVSTIWDNVSGEYMKRLNAVRRRAVKLLINDQNMSTDDKFRELKILPLDKQLTFNKAVIAHKIYHNKAPPYLSQLFRKATDRYGSIRLTLPSVRIDIFKSSLAYSGSVLWNKNIPNKLKGVSSTPSFKKHFRHYLHVN